MRRFQEEGCKVHCCVCAMKKFPLDFSFDMQVHGAHVSSSVYGQYLACTREIEVVEAQKVLFEKLCKAQAEIQELKTSTNGTSTEDRVLSITRLIGDTLVLPSCPSCQTSFVDFDGCCGLTCELCQANIKLYCNFLA